MDQNFEKIKEAVAKELSCSAHNMDHTMRVYNLCMKLAEGEDVDREVLGAAALLHDIARVKEDSDQTGKTDHALVGAGMAAAVLAGLDFPKEKIKHVQDCIISHRYRTDKKPETMEARILFDADKLDSLGAIGVARSFVWVGKNNAQLYANTDVHQYANDNLGGKINGRIKDKTKHSPQIEFETKLKFLADRLHTKKAKEVGKERTGFHRDFLKRLEKEINGEL